MRTVSLYMGFPVKCVLRCFDPTALNRSIGDPGARAFFPCFKLHRGPLFPVEGVEVLVFLLSVPRNQ